MDGSLLGLLLAQKLKNLKHGLHRRLKKFRVTRKGRTELFNCSVVAYMAILDMEEEFIQVHQPSTEEEEHERARRQAAEQTQREAAERARREREARERAERETEDKAHRERQRQAQETERAQREEFERARREATEKSEREAREKAERKPWNRLRRRFSGDPSRAEAPKAPMSQNRFLLLVLVASLAIISVVWALNGSTASNAVLPSTAPPAPLTPVVTDEDRKRWNQGPAADNPPTGARPDTKTEVESLYQRLVKEQAGNAPPRHFCDKGYCAEETVVKVKDGTRYGYWITLTNGERFASYCEKDANGDRTCYTSKGAAWVDREDGKGGWMTVKRLREHFPH
jgi:hypothetical protein